MTSITAEEEAALIERYHRNNIAPGQTCKVQTKRINAPIETVWSFVRRFDNPREFRSTITRCEIINDIVPDTIGCIRRVEIIPGMSVKESVERLHTFDEINYQIGFELIGGDLGLEHFRSLITLHPDIENGQPGTLVIDSYAVDVPEGRSESELHRYMRGTAMITDLRYLEQMIFFKTPLLPSRTVQSRGASVCSSTSTT
ncbi:hypothetical protein KP509_24G046400 [Ceratopteris richardii]|uniref:Uncharacterized protein n=1 Tax=Ceratopteris richardii TaxID=49495 RepID=A0A8T2RUE4_CERRI|nr:hypothetical protein KP509_24G046400 [Ceratopteris richardii]KAH7300146.1 hypothetical protein KP509_24G046400 [Ceratopteris richardii]KAH7300148.1 hypothetical protein KP509_24G046400 [Ceratopteris richardii]KAH7300149.1 hypothetical protein KP509_24G046400 [Ceratopteris richardii]